MAVASLNRYRPLSKIASGGMATITLAEDTVLGRSVALKRLSGTASQDGISRLRREALVGASVSHPNLVSIYDVVAENDDVVIVMEYVDGLTLRDAVAEAGRLAPAEALRILRGVASALDAIHARGIVHRDVKPPNILLGRGGEVKLADLGIAAAPDRTSITTEGSVLGSFSYMAPEQLEAAPAAPAMDVYALSAVAFEALSGRRARQEDNPLALAHAIATQPPPDLSAAWPEAPAAVNRLLKRGMSRNPADRPASAGQLVRDLEPALRPLLGAGAGAAGALAAGAAAAGAAAGASAADARPEGAAERPTAATRPVRASSGPASAQSPPGTRTRSAAADEGSPRRRSGWVVPALLGLVAIAVLAAVLGSGGSPRRSATHSTRTHAAARSKGPSKPASPAAHSTTSPTTPAGPGGNSTPVSAVERFYELAAAHDYSSAWALADPNFRNQLQGYNSFVAGQEGDRQIIFHSAQVTDQTANSATVAITDTSVRNNGTQQCAGTVDLKPGTGGWLLDHIDINCQPLPAQNPPAPGDGHGHGKPGKPGKPGKGH